MRKGLIAEFDRLRPSDQYQIVCRVELWYRLRVKGLFLHVIPEVHGNESQPFDHW